MAAKPDYKPRISNLVAGILCAGVIINWGLQSLLTLTVVGLPVAEVLGVLEDMVLATCFFFLGVYGASPKSFQNAVYTGAFSLVAIIPVIGDLIPVGLIEVLTIVISTRIEDRKIAEKKAAQAEKQKQGDQGVRNQRSLEARNRALSQGGQFNNSGGGAQRRGPGRVSRAG